MSNTTNGLVGLLKETGQTVEEVAHKASGEVKQHLQELESCSSGFRTARDQFHIVQENLGKINQAFMNIAKNVSNNDARINNVRTHMVKLEENAAAIKGLVDRISGLSDQTSLIALNASIQAARAGEQGKTFRIVAGEVEKLAAVTNTVNKGIGEIVSTILHSIQDVSKSVGEIRAAVSNSLANVNASKQNLTAMSDEIINFGSSLGSSIEAFEGLVKNSDKIDESFKEMVLVGVSLTSLIEVLTDQGFFKEVDVTERLVSLLGDAPEGVIADEERLEINPQDILIAVTDDSGAMTYVNSRYEEISGFKMTELKGKNLAQSAHPDLPKVLVRDLDEHLGQGKAWLGVVKYSSASGRPYWLRTLALPYSKGGKVVGHVAISKGATPREIKAIAKYSAK